MKKTLNIALSTLIVCFAAFGAVSIPCSSLFSDSHASCCCKEAVQEVEDSCCATVEFEEIATLADEDPCGCSMSETDGPIQLVFLAPEKTTNQEQQGVLNVLACEPTAVSIVASAQAAFTPSSSPPTPTLHTPTYEQYCSYLL